MLTEFHWHKLAARRGHRVGFFITYTRTWVGQTAEEQEQTETHSRVGIHLTRSTGTGTGVPVISKATPPHRQLPVLGISSSSRFDSIACQAARITGTHHPQKTADAFLTSSWCLLYRSGRRRDVGGAAWADCISRRDGQVLAQIQRKGTTI